MRESRRLFAAAAVTAIGLAVAAALILGHQGPADSSTLSRAGSGWLAARLYLEETGAQVTLLDRDLETPVPRGVLVLAFPFQRLAIDDVAVAIDRHLQGGGNLVFAYADRREGSQSIALSALGLGWDERRPRPPLDPRRWRAYSSEEWTLSAEEAGARPARIAALRRVPRAPKDARVLLRDAQGRPVAFVLSRWRGKAAVIPAEAWANARLGQPGNADLLETLRRELGEVWLFDEFHHGLRAPLAAAETGPQHVLLLYVLQVAFVYALCALAVARRFGPPWREPMAARGSAATFLVGLGALHDRLGHHRAAGRLLTSRAQELDPRMSISDEGVVDAKGLLGLARRVGMAQSGKGRSA